jgi:hypothetical protein
MTEQYTPPFEGGKDPDPTTKAKTANRAKRLARRAMKKAAMKEEADKSGLSPEQIARRKEMDRKDFANRRNDMNAKRQAGTAPLRTTYREEVELDEAFINGREYASHGLMHPKHAMQGIHQPSDRFVDFYASGTGDKMMGKVKSNDGKSVHIQAHPKLGDGKLHKFKVTTDLPKMTNEAKDEGEYDYEGDMAMSQLKSVITNAQKLHDMLEPDTNLPEWVQSKITLAEDYIVTAANYMDGEMNEEVEQIDELSKKTLSSYVKKAYWDQGKRTSNASQVYGYVAGKYNRKATRGEIHNALGAKEVRRDKTRDTGVERALSRLAKEDYAYDRTKKVIPPTKKPEPVPVSKKGFGQLGPEKRENNKGSSSHMSEMAASERDRYEEPRPKPPGRPTPIPDGLPRPGNRPKPIPPMGALKKIEEKKMGYDQLISTINAKRAKKKLKEATDPVGKEDADINNDGKTDKTDVYLHTKRRAIGKAIGTRLATKAGK